MNKEYQICTKCIMDTTDPNIVFDEKGECNHCKAYRNAQRFLHTEKELAEEVKKIKASSKGKYDCVLGISGGVDSCMAAYTAKRMGLNPLAIHLDTGWDTEIAKENAKKVLGKLGIDLYTCKIDYEEFKDLQMAFLKASVSNIDYPSDHAIVAMFYQQALKNKVKYIIIGTNVKTEFIEPDEWGYISWDLKHLRAIHKRFGRIKKLKTFPTISLWQFVYYSLIKKIQRFSILNYIDYNKKEAKEFLNKEFGWQDYGAKHCESIYTRFVMGYFWPRKFGFDRNRGWMSTLVLSGQKTRDEALAELEKGFYSSEKEMNDENNYIMKELGLTHEEFEKIMKAPPKSHKEYPNNSIFFEKLVFIFSFVKRLIVR